MLNTVQIGMCCRPVSRSGYYLRRLSLSIKESWSGPADNRAKKSLIRVWALRASIPLSLGAEQAGQRNLGDLFGDLFGCQAPGWTVPSGEP